MAIVQRFAVLNRATMPGHIGKNVIKIAQALDIVKKWLAQGRELDKDYLAKEFGDIGNATPYEKILFTRQRD